MNVKRYQEIAAALLKKHYGLQLSDTHLENELVVVECINQGYRPYQVVAEHAAEADLDRIDKTDYGVPSKKAISVTDEDAVINLLSAVLNDRYDETIAEYHGTYSALEIHGVRDCHLPNDPQGSHCEVDNENPQFFSVYARLPKGGLECVGDFGTHALADSYAKELATKYQWPIHDYVPLRISSPA